MLPSVSQYCILFKETILRTPEEHFQADLAENTRCMRKNQPEPPKHLFFYAGFYCTIQTTNKDLQIQQTLNKATTRCCQLAPDNYTDLD